MSSSPEPRPTLSEENADRLNQALQLTRTLQSPAPDADDRLVQLRMLLDRCRTGLKRQNPRHLRQRLEALNQARNYLHFLPDMQHAQAAGRLRSVSRRLRRVLQA